MKTRIFYISILVPTSSPPPIPSTYHPVPLYPLLREGKAHCFGGRSKALPTISRLSKVYIHPKRIGSQKAGTSSRDKS